MKLPWVKSRDKPFFKGYYTAYSKFKDPYSWTQFINIPNKPINYLEIGVLTGINTIRILATYCSHPDSKVYCVDPWKECDEYSEYKGQQDKNYLYFLWNIEQTGQKEKYVIKKEFSDTAVPSFEDNFFDLVLVDGNHETDFVYKDAVMCLPKTKPGGHIVFDDYDWPDTKKGIDKFLKDYKDQIEIVGGTKFQLFIKKL
jgi:predicted O-methyltransferase YrrM